MLKTNIQPNATENSIFKPWVISAVREIKHQLNRPCPLYLVCLIIFGGCLIGGYELFRLQSVRRWNYKHFHALQRNFAKIYGLNALVVHERHKEELKNLPRHQALQLGRPTVLNISYSWISNQIEENRCGTITINNGAPYRLVYSDPDYPIHHRYFKISDAKNGDDPIAAFRFDNGLSKEDQGSGYANWPKTQKLMFVPNHPNSPGGQIRKTRYFVPRFQAHYYLNKRGTLYEIMIKDGKVIGWVMSLNRE